MHLHPQAALLANIANELAAVLVREAATEPPTDDARVPATPRQVMAYRPVVTPVRAAPRQLADDIPATEPVHRGVCPRCQSEWGAFGIIPKFCPTCGVPMASVQDGPIAATDPPCQTFSESEHDAAVCKHCGWTDDAHDGAEALRSYLSPPAQTPRVEARRDQPDAAMDDLVKVWRWRGVDWPSPDFKQAADELETLRAAHWAAHPQEPTP